MLNFLFLLYNLIMKFEEFICLEDKHTFRSKNHILQDIFKDWWEPFCSKYSNLNIRPIVFKEVINLLAVVLRNVYPLFPTYSLANSLLYEVVTIIIFLVTFHKKSSYRSSFTNCIYTIC